MKYYISTLYTEIQQPCNPVTNKTRAIQIARIAAAELKESTIIHNQEGDAIAICEFPYYLRDLPLTAKDITVVRI